MERKERKKIEKKITMKQERKKRKKEDHTIKRRERMEGKR